MPQKPLDQLTPSYRKRIERGLLKGKSRQEARGKKAGEHIIRKQREIAQGKFPSHQQQQINKFAREQARRGGNSFEDTREQIIKLTLGDFNRFKQIRAKRDAFKKKPPGDNFKSQLEDEFDLSIAENEYWFYYH